MLSWYVEYVVVLGVSAVGAFCDVLRDRSSISFGVCLVWHDAQLAFLWHLRHCSPAVLALLVLDDFDLITPAYWAGVHASMDEREMAVLFPCSPRDVAAVLQELRPATLRERVAEVLDRAGIRKVEFLGANVTVFELDGVTDRALLLNLLEGLDVRAE